MHVPLVSVDAVRIAVGANQRYAIVRFSPS